MKNPIFKLTGVSEEMEYASPAGKGLLMIFSLFVIISLGLTFACWYIFFNNSNMTYVGIFAGILFGVIILVLDKGLFAEGEKIFVRILTRVIVIAVLALITSYVFGIGIADETLKKEIRKDHARSQQGLTAEIQAREKKYSDDVDEINERMLTDIRKKPSNTDEIRSVYEQMKFDKQEAKERDIVNLKRKHGTQNATFSLNDKINKYNNLPNSMRFGKFYWLFFIIEILPLIVYIAFKLVEDD